MRLFRLLLDPTAVAGGGAPAVPAVPVAPAAPAQTVPAVPNPHPAAVQPPPANAAPLTVNYNVQAPAPPAAAGQPNQAPAAPASPPSTATAQQTVTIPLEQLQAFTSIQARLAQMEADQRTREQAAQAEQARLMAEQGRIQEALNLTRQQAQSDLERERGERNRVEQAAQRFALDGELSRALASHNLVPGGAEQLATLWRGHFTATPENGTYAVRNAQYQTPAEFVNRMLSDPAAGYAHFLRAQNPGGGTATGQPIQSPQTPPANANNLTPEQQFAAICAANPNMSMGERLELAGKLKIYGAHAPQPDKPELGEGGRPILRGFGLPGTKVG